VPTNDVVNSIEDNLLTLQATEHTLVNYVFAQNGKFGLSIFWIASFSIWATVSDNLIVQQFIQFQKESANSPIVTCLLKASNLKFRYISRIFHTGSSLC